MSTDGSASAATRAVEAHVVLVALLFKSASVDGYLEEFARTASGALGMGTQCSVTLRHLGHDRRAASSDARAARCGNVAIAARSGPGLTALDEHRTVVGTEIGASARWLRWRAAALHEGFLSVVAVAADAGPGASIALTLYSEDRNPWSPELMGKAEVFAQQIARVMALCLTIADQARQITDQEIVSSDLQTAMASRSTIDQAIGAIMAQNRCSAQEGFDILRLASSHRNVKLRQVASELLRGISAAPAPGKLFHPRNHTS